MTDLEKRSAEMVGRFFLFQICSFLFQVSSFKFKVLLDKGVALELARG